MRKKLETRELLLSNGNTVYYKVRNGTCYQYAIRLKDGTYEERDDEDMDKLTWTLEFVRNYKDRIRLWYGDPITGCSWNEEHDVIGYISRSCGKYPIPILLPTKKSIDGVGILTQKIIRIDYTPSHTVMYQHPKFHVEPMKVYEEEDSELNKKGYFAAVYQEKQDIEGCVCVARFKNRKQAENYIKFLNGERYCK